MLLVRVVRVPGRGVDRSGTVKVEHEEGLPGGKRGRNKSDREQKRVKKRVGKA